MKRKKQLRRQLQMEHDLFADDLSDETVWALRSCLQSLQMALENRYLGQLMRHSKRLESLYDTARPWKTPPSR